MLPRGGGERRKTLKRWPTARSNGAIWMSARDGQSCTDILKDMKAQVNSTETGLEVLPIRRTRKDEDSSSSRKGGCLGF